MQNANQTKNASNGNDRDAAIQIPGGESKGKLKFCCIWDGARAEILADPERAPRLKNDGSCLNYLMNENDMQRQIIGRFAYIIELLTSSDKFGREYAKKRVRELVKLGREQSTFNQGDMK